MECWEKYNKLLMPLPYKTGWTEHPVRVLNPEQWKKTEKNDILEYETKIIRENKDTGERLFLRFQRAGCKAWLYENGELLGNHYGSFTEWQEELKASGDLESEIKLVLKGDEGNLSPFEKAGLFGDVFLVSLPEIFLKDVRIDTGYQEGWKLKVAVEADFGRRKEAVQLRVLLTDAENKKHLVYEEWEIAPENAETELVLNMSEVQPWSTENPVLYELTLQLFQGKEFLEEYQTKIGFRRIERKGNQIFWNEVPLKLRGICYREPLGEEGHFLETDLRLFKESGINYMRSLFYPFSEKALEICDRLGILTEQSASVYKVGKGCRASQDLPDCRRLYGEQFSELLKSSRNHVSVLLWSLGSESIWGRNFFLCAQMAEALAPKQLLNFSYPMTIPKEEAIQMDVWSVLYADWKQPLDKMYDHMEIGHANVCDNEIGYVTGHTYREIRPVLHEIYAHLPCYNRDQILRDYGIHEFWGESLVRFQKSMEKTEGALGGSVMAGYDEDGSFSWLLEGCEWGILDSDHRPKPEYYHLKMVFSGQKPQCLEGIAVEAQREKEERRSVKKIFGKDYKIAEDDSFVIREEQENYLCLEETQGIKVSVSKKTGLLSGVWRNGEKLIESGPYLHTEKLLLGKWIPRAPYVEKSDRNLHICLSGCYEGVCSLEFELSVTGEGVFDTAYTVTELYRHMPPRVKAQIGLDPGGLDELGISYILPYEMDTIQWERHALWKEYTEMNPGRGRGKAHKGNRRDFESMKHHISYAQVSGEGENAVFVKPMEECSIRMKEEPALDYVIDDRDSRILYHGDWIRTEDPSGNWKNTETASRNAGDFLEFSFEGTGIRMYGPVDRIGGLYRIILDGQTIKNYGSSYPLPVDIDAASRGYEKRYRVCMAEVQGLHMGCHTIRLEVLGERARGGNDTWVSIDYIEVINGKESRQIRMILNHGYNYTRLVRGNYMRNQVKIEPGKTHQVRLYLTDRRKW